MESSKRSLAVAICAVAFGACGQVSRTGVTAPTDGASDGVTARSDGLTAPSDGAPACTPDLELIAGSILPTNGSYADGPAADALFNGPNDMELDPDGNLWVADTWNDVIRKISPGGVVSTVAGVAGEPGTSDGTGAGARFNHPTGLTRTPDGNFYVVDSLNDTIRELTPSGVVTTIAGAPGVQGGEDGTDTQARFYQPASVVYAAPYYYLVDQFNNTIRSMDASTVSTIVGVADVAGSTDGTGSAALFDTPIGIVIGGDGAIYVTDVVNDTIRRIVGDSVTTIAGSPGIATDVDGVGAEARFDYPRGIAIDAHDNIYIAEQNGHLIRKVVRDAKGWLVTTIGGGSPNDVGIRLGTDFALLNPLALRISGTSLLIADTNAILELNCAVAN
jgi:hypothetical protein